ncbi:DNA-binding protein [Yersinia ruckeri]|uniref:MuA-transposase/repressor protein CI DNA-binding protein n=1 Tax=Yersinia ruckeri TaxID=29486 RepID=A0A0A8VD34_YERRU|nr:DNA-binding protein [Yersinia ruckeri]EEP97759.1 MuA-transposase/repressor protein CI DNA-binding [Yersinia ruckeri ATCC 29473]KGA49183.1 mu DNA-binding domain protein [Yersinia ruckeri ATCC 29473]MCK8596160.1 putative DNA-binding transcriptional regulator [Yersinia ruckeri]MCK8599456.1 putative DNA-binding transcriptional regulator [Yersinia ruckeri]MCW6611702.1 putative DNA-binding transcriptional regulator [Yersinia ruckeri]
MKKQWFSAKELTGIAGLPSSPQGINQMARREDWELRRRRGVQGKAIEYHINSLPSQVLELIRMREEPAEYVIARQDPLQVWIEAYYQLTEAERELVIAFIFREGVGKLLARLANR